MAGPASTGTYKWPMLTKAKMLAKRSADHEEKKTKIINNKIFNFQRYKYLVNELECGF